MTERKQGYSPTPSAPPLMDFPTAVAMVIEGKKITKLEWDDPGVVGALHEGRLMILLDDGLWHPWIVSDGDLLGRDWVVAP